jgi:hypothetical protein
LRIAMPYRERRKRPHIAEAYKAGIESNEQP